MASKKAFKRIAYISNFKRNRVNQDAVEALLTTMKCNYSCRYSATSGEILLIEEDGKNFLGLDFVQLVGNMMLDY